MTEEERDELIFEAMFNVKPRKQIVKVLGKHVKDEINNYMYTNMYPVDHWSSSQDYAKILKKEKLEAEFSEALRMAKNLNFSDEELAERFKVSLSTFQTWHDGRFPFSSLQREFILFINCARIEILICNQCDKKRISTEMRKTNSKLSDFTCKTCLGEI